MGAKPAASEVQYLSAFNTILDSLKGLSPNQRARALRASAMLLGIDLDSNFDEDT